MLFYFSINYIFLTIQGTKGSTEEYNVHFSREEIEIKTPENTMEIIKPATVTGLFVLFSDIRAWHMYQSKISPP